MSVPAGKHVWRAVAIAVAILFTYAAVLAKLSRDWWTDENYSHGLLVPFIIGYILWLQRDKFATEPARPTVLLGGLAGEHERWRITRWWTADVPPAIRDEHWKFAVAVASFGIECPLNLPQFSREPRQPSR